MSHQRIVEIDAELFDAAQRAAVAQGLRADQILDRWIRIGRSIDQRVRSDERLLRVVEGRGQFSELEDSGERAIVHAVIDVLHAHNAVHRSREPDDGSPESDGRDPVGDHDA